MHPRRTISARSIMADIRSGMTAPELMEKYKFSAKALRMIFRKLLDRDVVSKTELDERENLYPSSVEESLRQVPRKRVRTPLSIYEAHNPFVPGMVKDISEKGICIEGIKAFPGEVKNFIIRSGLTLGGGTVVFEAKCRWSQNEGSKPLAGYEIVGISGFDSKALQKIIGK
jgi:hypothetical protein